MRVHAVIIVLLTISCGGTPQGGVNATDAVDAADTVAPAPQIPTDIDLTRWDPQWYRPHEISLSGPWDFAFDPEGDGVDGYDLEINVPFPWQAVLSGVGPEPPAEYPPLETEAVLQTYRGDAWYRRTIIIPEDWPADHKTWLRFGAVDWETRVFIDGVEAGHHVGGYTAFEVPLDATPGDVLEIEVQVTDPCDDDEAVLIGKQGGMWYTCAGGIWQDVTLSHGPGARLTGIADIPTTDGLDVTVQVSGDSVPARVRMSVACLEDACGEPCGPWTVEGDVDPSPEGMFLLLTLPLHDAPVWSPDIPCLLGREIVLESANGTDRVLGYTARRATSIDWVPGHGPDDGVPPDEQYKDLLNDGRPVHLRAVLDQGYHPAGIWQAPTRADRIADLEAMKILGMNGVRMHIKPEPPWYYAAADRLGLWVVYDMPCPWDQAPSGPGAVWHQHWEAAVRDLVARDRNRPSILWWVNFNEAWGLINPPFWGNEEGTSFVEEMYLLVRELDPTRPVEDHSPGGFSEILGVLPHVDTDVNSFHAYVADPEGIAARIASYADGVFPGSTDNVFGGPPQDGAPLIVSEMGGQWAGGTWGDAGYPLHAWLNAMRMEPKIRGWVFTQLTDVEWETNGLLTYDRQPKDLGLADLGLQLADLLQDEYLHLGLDPILVAGPGDPVSIDVSAASMGGAIVQDVTVELRSGELVLDSKTVEGGVLPDGITALGALSFDAPLEDGIYQVFGLMIVEDGADARQGLYLVVDDGEGPSPGRLAPEIMIDDGQGECPEGRACRCAGTCALSFVLSPPEPGTWQISLQGEFSTYDGPPQQTDPVLTPGDIEVYLDGDAEPVEILHVTDAPADHRGVLSLGPAWPALRGAYGEQVEVDLGIRTVGDVVTLTLAAEDTGVQVFFRNGGRHLDAPRVVFEAVE